MQDSIYQHTALPCIVCHKRLENMESPDENHPNDAVVCHTHGNYGSTVFDEIRGHYLEFNICDECLKKARAQKLIALGFRHVPLRTWTEGLEDSLLDEGLKRAGGGAKIDEVSSGDT